MTEGGAGVYKGCALPAIMRERLVRFSHSVRVFLLLDGVALTLRRRDHLGGELLGHRLLVAAARERDEPAHSERRAAVRTNFNRNLIGGTADSAALHFDGGLEIRPALLEVRDPR